MSVHWKAYHLNKMIQDAMRNPALMGRLMESPEAVFTEYRLSEAEKEVFRAPTAPALRSVGVHPVLAMVYMIPHDESARRQLSMDPVFLDKIKEF